MIAPSRLLCRYTCIETDNLDELSAFLSWSRTHAIEGASRLESSSVVSHVALTAVKLGYLTHTGSTRDRVGASASELFVLVPFVGGGTHVIAGRRLPLNAASGAVHSPDHHAEVAVGGRSGLLSITIQQAAVKTELENSLQRSVVRPIRFSPHLRLNGLGGSLLRDSVTRICRFLDQHGPQASRSLAVRQMERLLISHLLDFQPHTYTRLLRRVSSAAPWQVRAAESFIRANADQPLTLSDLASLTGVSSRTLHYSFRRHRGYSPMEFLRTIRFEAVRTELTTELPGTRVSHVAAKWGFLHFGRFASEYQHRFGELPSATLRSAKSAA